MADNDYQKIKTGAEIPIVTLTEQASAPSNPDSGNRKFYVKSDGNAYILDSSGTEVQIGSGSSVGINYITNYAAETNTTGWAAYADAAGTSPVDGTGGSPTTTITRTTSSPLRDTGSFLITAGTNAQGEGVSYDFTIDSADKAKILNISFDYAIASGTFVSGDSSDIRVFIYDVTNSALIPVSPATIQGGSAHNWKFTGTFQTASDSTSYRLILHVAPATNSAFTFKFDNVVVGPQIIEYGAPIGDWTAYTPTFTGFGTVTNDEFYYRRVGDSVEIAGAWTNGTCTATEARISLPSGMTSADTTKITSIRLCGMRVKTTAVAEQSNVLIEPSVTYMTFSRQHTSDGGLTKKNGDDIFTNSEKNALFATVPIAGWGSAVLMSNDTDTRVVAAGYKTASGTLSDGVENIIKFTSKQVDTHSAYNTSTGYYTCPVSGVYEVNVALRINGTLGDADNYVTYLYKNASQTYSQITYVSSNVELTTNITGLFSCTAGDTLSVTGVPNSISSPTYSTGILSIKRLSGPSAIAASEKIYLQYTGNGGTSLTADTTNIDFATKVVDSHGAWSGTVFTAPRAGFYIVQGQWLSTANVGVDTELYVGGVENIRLFADYASATNHPFHASIYLTAGQQLSLRQDGTATLSNSSGSHWISIYSQG